MLYIILKGHRNDKFGKINSNYIYVYAIIQSLKNPGIMASLTFPTGGAGGVMVMDVGNVHDALSSNPGRYCLYSAER